MALSKEQVTDSLRGFTSRRDDLLHEDEATFGHNLKRFVEFCEADLLVQTILGSITTANTADANAWWEANIAQRDRQVPDLPFPDNADEELLLRFEILRLVAADSRKAMYFGLRFWKRNTDEGIQMFRTMIVRPFAEELGNRLSKAANLATPEERALQAVPLNRIPRMDEVKIFLSHKSVDKPLVRRYYQALKQLGFDPWLDDPEMPAGSNLERELLRGFEESCAAVFFITDNFKDERYLATEVDYAVIQKRKKGKKFAIITLQYSNAAPVPSLLTPYIYKTAENDLEGFYELLRALPVELGPIRWKSHIVEE